MSLDKPEYSKKDLTKIRKSLGKHGLQAVAEKLEMNANAVRMVLFEPSRYNEKVFDAVADVLETKKRKLQEQKLRIKQAI